MIKEHCENVKCYKYGPCRGSEETAWEPGRFPVPSRRLSCHTRTEESAQVTGDLETPQYFENNTSNPFQKFNEMKLILFSYVIATKGIANLSNFKPHRIRTM